MVSQPTKRDNSGNNEEPGKFNLQGFTFGSSSSINMIFGNDQNSGYITGSVGGARPEGGNQPSSTTGRGNQPRRGPRGGNPPSGGPVPTTGGGNPPGGIWLPGTGDKTINVNGDFSDLEVISGPDGTYIQHD